MTVLAPTLSRFLRATCALALVFTFAACDSGDSEPDNTDTDAPTVLSASTNDGSTLTVTFNEPVDPTTVTAAAFTVTPGATVASASGSGSSATLVLAAELSDDDPTTYTVTVNGVADAAGNAASGASATFRYPAGGGGNSGGSEVGAAYPNAGDSRIILFNTAGDRFLVFNPVTGAVTDPDDIDDLENRLIPLDNVGASVSVFAEEETYFFSTDGDTFTNYERNIADFDAPASFEEEYDESGYELSSIGAAYNSFDSDQVILFNQNGTEFQSWDVENDSFGEVQSFPADFGGGNSPISAVGAAVYRQDSNQIYLFNRDGSQYTIFSGGNSFTAAFDVEDLGDIAF
jgi:hypothetical protein